VSIIRSANATSSRPAGESSTLANASRPARVRGFSPAGTLVKQLRLQPLLPGGALIDQRLAQPHART
jgi:hypothetical protein